jgi:hypothetical protein
MARVPGGSGEPHRGQEARASAAAISSWTLVRSIASEPAEGMADALAVSAPLGTNVSMRGRYTPVRRSNVTS